MKNRNLKIICVDVDDVCVRLVPHWLSLYNKDVGDSLREEDITEWDITKFVKTRPKNKIFTYLSNPNIYDGTEAVPDALRYISLLKRLGHRIVYVTFRGDFSNSGRKFNWLNENGFNVEDKDYIETNDKSLIYGDYLIDDNYENVEAFRGCGVLYTKPWNENKDYIYRVDNWKDFYWFVKEMEEKVE